MFVLVNSKLCCESAGTSMSFVFYRRRPCSDSWEINISRTNTRMYYFKEITGRRDPMLVRGRERKSTVSLKTATHWAFPPFQKCVN